MLLGIIDPCEAEAGPAMVWDEDRDGRIELEDGQDPADCIAMLSIRQFILLDALD